MDAKTKFEATLETKISKSGNEYQVLVIKLTPRYEKTCFLDRAEAELIQSLKTK